MTAEQNQPNNQNPTDEKPRRKLSNAALSYFHSQGILNPEVLLSRIHIAEDAVGELHILLSGKAT